MKRPLLVSACLMGEKCRYDGKHSKNDILNKVNNCISVCPEILGDLSTPRLPAELQGNSNSILLGNNRILDINKVDVTNDFVNGSKRSLRIAKKNNVKTAILKTNSPTCGFRYVYDGSFSNTLKEGNGLFAQLCINNGINVISSDDKNSIIEVINSNKDK